MFTHYRSPVICDPDRPSLADEKNDIIPGSIRQAPYTKMHVLANSAHPQLPTSDDVAGKVNLPNGGRGNALDQ